MVMFFGAYFCFFQLNSSTNDSGFVIGARRLYTSDGAETSNNRSVMAVVTLESNIQLIGQEDGSWNIQG